MSVGVPALLMKPAADGNKQFLWFEVLLLMDCSLLLERIVYVVVITIIMAIGFGILQDGKKV